MGYFNVLWAGLATELRPGKLQELFAQNFHVGHKKIYEDQKQRLVLVKGGKGSRLLKNAVQMSSVGKDKNGKPLKVLSPGMRRIFGDFHGKISVQRSPPRWVQADFVERAAKFVKSLK